MPPTFKPSQLTKTFRICGGMCSLSIGLAGIQYLGWRTASLALGSWLLLVVAGALFLDSVERRDE